MKESTYHVLRTENNQDTALAHKLMEKLRGARSLSYQEIDELHAMAVKAHHSAVKTGHAIFDQFQEHCMDGEEDNQSFKEVVENALQETHSGLQREAELDLLYPQLSSSDN